MPAVEAASAEAVQSYPRSFFDRFNPQTALGMIERLPGFTLDAGDDDLRGFGSAAGNVLIDGAPLSVDAQNGAQSLWDVGQVEVLRGPQSTVQGRNALAGAINVVPFDPEFVTNYELAFRSQWLDRRLTINANLFYTDWSDQQISIPGPSGSPAALDAIIVTAGSSRLYGLELSVSARPTDGLDLFATLGLLDTQFTNFPFVDTPSQTPNDFENLAGNTFPSAPNVTVAAGVNYEHASGAYTSWTLSYRGPQESDVTNLDANQADGYVLINARGGYSFGAVNVYAFANNLCDERFATRNEFTAVNRETGDIVTRDNARFQVNEPRVAGIALEMRF